MPPRRITIFDTTLRDGEQSPGIALQPDEKAEIAAQLERLGVDVIEAGFPISSPGDFEGVQAVARAVAGATVAALARTSRTTSRPPPKRSPARAARGSTSSSRRARCTWPASSGSSRAEVLEQRADERPHAQPSTPTRSSSRPRTRPVRNRRSSPRSAGQAIEAGATTVNLPDTVGYCLPDEHEAFLRRMQALCPELRDVTLSVHCHNDLGLAVANTLSGIRAGATQVECTVNGIGERAGNAALEEVVMALRVRADELRAETGVNVGEIGVSSALVSRLTGYAVQRNKAIVGANAFAHEAGIHQDGMLKDAATYQIMDPEELGLTMTLPLGKHSGRHAFARACADAGIELPARRAPHSLCTVQAAGRRAQGRDPVRRLRGGAVP